MSRREAKRFRAFRLPAAVAFLLILVDLLLMDQRPWTVAPAVLAVLLLAVAARAAALDMEDVGLGADRLWSGARLGGVLSGMVVLGYVAATWLPFMEPAFDDDRTPQDLGSVLAKVLIVIPLRTVLLEEFAFRGVLWGWLATLRDERVATWGSSLAFGLWHVPPAFVVLETHEALAVSSTQSAALVVAGIVVGTTAAGVLFAELRRRTGSLVAPVILHWTVNSAGVMASYSVR